MYFLQFAISNSLLELKVNPITHPQYQFAQKTHITNPHFSSYSFKKLITKPPFYACLTLSNITIPHSSSYPSKLSL